MPYGPVLHHIISGAGHKTSVTENFFNLTVTPWDVSGKFTFPTAADSVPRALRRSTGGLVYIELRNLSGSVEYYNCNGTFLYSFDVQPRNCTSNWCFLKTLMKRLILFLWQDHAAASEPIYADLIEKVLAVSRLVTGWFL